MENLHDEAVRGSITLNHNDFSREPYHYLTNLPDLPQIYIDDVLHRPNSDYTYFPPDRPNRTPLIDNDSLFDTTNLVKDCNYYFGYCASTILRFDPMTVLDWHVDNPRKCAMNILINEVDDMSRTFMREKVEGWNYKMIEIKYSVGKPILIDTSLQHTTYNFHPTKTRYVLSISFGRVATYEDVKEYLMLYKDYN